MPRLSRYLYLLVIKFSSLILSVGRPLKLPTLLQHLDHPANIPVKLSPIPGSKPPHDRRLFSCLGIPSSSDSSIRNAFLPLRQHLSSSHSTPWGPYRVSLILFPLQFLKAALTSLWVCSFWAIHPPFLCVPHITCTPVNLTSIFWVLWLGDTWKIGYVSLLNVSTFGLPLQGA